jgi:hypothetical protein
MYRTGAKDRFVRDLTVNETKPAEATVCASFAEKEVCEATHGCLYSIRKYRARKDKRDKHNLSVCTRSATLSTHTKRERREIV